MTLNAPKGRKISNRTIVVALLAIAVVGAGMLPAAEGHGAGGIPAELDSVHADLTSFRAAADAAWIELNADNDVLFSDHDAQDTRLVGLASDHDAQDTALSGLAGDHDVQDTAHAGLSGDHDAQDSALSGLAGDHDAQDAALNGLAVDHDQLAADVATLLQRSNFLQVSAISSQSRADAGEAPEAPNTAAILARVTFAGAGVSGLPQSAFTLATHFVPEGECNLEIDTLTDIGGGDYALLVTPIDSEGCDWAAGDYLSSLSVADGARRGGTVVGVTIAEAPAPAASGTSEDRTDTATHDESGILGI